MERRGLIQREGTDGADGRQVALRITARGAAIVSRFRPQVDALDRHFMAKLDTGQTRALMQALAILAEGETNSLTRL